MLLINFLWFVILFFLEVYVFVFFCEFLNLVSNFIFFWIWIVLGLVGGDCNEIGWEKYVFFFIVMVVEVVFIGILVLLVFWEVVLCNSGEINVFFDFIFMDFECIKEFMVKGEGICSLGFIFV